ncbi:MAG: DUF262 domain-containing protein [Ahrensia sp.]|nr:DUF262 domain-containing protein [Ahrensia sp.]
MEMNKKAWALPTVCKMQARIDPTPDYQRPPVWSRKQKQLLMDTILRNYDIPKFYWRSVKRSDGIQYEVIDGQQRLRAIWEFAADGYPLAKDIDPVKGFNVSGNVFSQLPPKLWKFLTHILLMLFVVTDASRRCTRRRSA